VAVLVVHDFVAVPPGAFGVPLVAVLVVHDRVAAPSAACTFTSICRDVLVVVGHLGSFPFRLLPPMILDISTEPVLLSVMSHIRKVFAHD
jgi:hypothetical protein